MWIGIPREEKLPPVHYALVPMKFEVPTMRLGPQRHPPLPDGRGSAATITPVPTQPLMVKMLLIGTAYLLFTLSRFRKMLAAVQ